MRKSLLSLLLLVLSVGIAWAQKQVIVTGIVVAADDKEPVVAASVTSREGGCEPILVGGLIYIASYFDLYWSHP